MLTRNYTSILNKWHQPPCNPFNDYSVVSNALKIDVFSVLFNLSLFKKNCIPDTSYMIQSKNSNLSSYRDSGEQSVINLVFQLETDRVNLKSWRLIFNRLVHYSPPCFSPSYTTTMLFGYFRIYSKLPLGLHSRCTRFFSRTFINI